MKARIVKIGNSQGIRIPKPLILQAGLKGEVDLQVEDNRLVISRRGRPRGKWALAYSLMAQRGDDKLLDGDVLTGSQWDEEGWQWK
ncbi:MAG: AbrB/MazE/SpoVT family DNA-binding domain-containing protein [bacterium]